MGERRILPDGTEIERLPDGRVVRVNQGPQMPMNPKFPYEGPQAGANLQKTRAEIENDRKNTDLAQQKFVADLYKEGLQPGPNGPVPIPGWQKPNAAQGGRPDATKAQFDDALAQYNAADYLTKEIGKLRESYAKGPGATSGLAGIGDFFPTPANQGFDKAAGRLRAFAKQGTGTTGGENNSVAEMKLNLGSYIPSASDFDSTNSDTFTSLQELADKTRSEAIQRLGGVPDASGRIVPLGAQNAMTQNYVLPGANAGAADRGSDTQSVPVPAGMQQAHQAYIASHAGNLDPMAYARFRAEMDKQYGYPVTPEKEDEYRAFAEQANKAAQRGGSTINPNIPNVDQPLSGLDAFRNNMVNNPIGAAAVGALDMGGFGGVSALTGDKMSALGDANPISMAGGQIAGSIGGTAMLGRLGRETLARALPKLMQGGGKAQFGRNLATDAAYSGIYGANTGQNPLEAAAMGSIGSVGGQVLGKGIGSALGGMNLSPAVEVLRNAKVRTTVGQNLGGFAKNVEDAMTSIPGVGDIVNARRLEGFQDFNRAAFDRAGQPIGASVNETGEQGIRSLLDQTGTAYDNATAGVSVPLDPQFATDMAMARQAGQMLPADLAPRFDQAIANRVEPIATAGQMTGDTYQQAMRGLKGYRSEVTKPGFEQDYRDALGMGMDAMRGQMTRGGGESVVRGLGNADQSYRLAKTLEKAVQAAKNGSGSGEIQTFTPAQLNTSATQNANKFGGARPFGDLIDAGQSVMPSTLPDSGTAKRLLMATIASGVGGAGIGTGLGYAGGDTQEGATKGLAAGLLLALGGTKGGQAFINKALIDRPAIVRKAGRAISKRKGLFGAAGVPLALESSN